MPYLIRTNYFGITLSEFHLLRSGFPYKKFSKESISSITVKYGIRTKYPIRTLIFGIFLLLLAYITFDQFLFFLIKIPSEEPGINDYAHSYRVIWALIMVSGFAFFIGVYSIFLSLKKGLILHVVFKDSIEIFTLKELPKPNGVFELMDTCRQIYGSRFENQSDYGMK